MHENTVQISSAKKFPVNKSVYNLHTSHFNTVTDELNLQLHFCERVITIWSMLSNNNNQEQLSSVDTKNFNQIQDTFYVDFYFGLKMNHCS